MGKKRNRRQSLPGVTAQQVAKSLGLSQSTVSRAFTDTASIHPRTRERYQGGKLARLSTEYHRPKPYHAAYQHRRRGHGQPDRSFLSPGPRTARPKDTVERPAIAFLHDSPRQARRRGAAVAPAIQSGRHPNRISDGFVAYGSGLLVEGIPVVLFNRYVPGLKVAAVCCDNVAAGRAVADYLSRKAIFGRRSCPARATSLPILIARAAIQRAIAGTRHGVLCRRDWGRFQL